jgi:hypothetical protein
MIVLLPWGTGDATVARAMSTTMSNSSIVKEWGEGDFDEKKGEK